MRIDKKPVAWEATGSLLAGRVSDNQPGPLDVPHDERQVDLVQKKACHHNAAGAVIQLPRRRERRDGHLHRPDEC